MNTKSSTFSVRLPENIKEEVAKIAQLQNRSSAFIIKAAVESYIAENNAYIAAIEDGQKDAQEGRLINASTAREFINNLKNNPNLEIPIA